MFQLTPNPTFDALVKGFVPGRAEEGCKVTYRYKSAEDFKAWIDSFGDRTLGDVLMDIVVGWRDAPREFSREALDEIARIYPAFVPKLIETYREELFEGRRKN